MPASRGFQPRRPSRSAGRAKSSVWWRRVARLLEEKLFLFSYLHTTVGGANSRPKVYCFISFFCLLLAAYFPLLNTYQGQPNSTEAMLKSLTQLQYRQREHRVGLLLGNRRRPPPDQLPWQGLYQSMNDGWNFPSRLVDAS